MESKRTKLLKNKHPQNSSNFLSKLFFCWTLPLFYKGYRKVLTEEDLYQPLKSHQSCRLGDKLESIWKDQKRRNKQNPKLWKILSKMFFWECFWQGLMLIVMEIGLVLIQPYLLQKLLDYYLPDQQEISEKDAYIYSISLIIVLFINSLANQHYMLLSLHLGMKVKVAITSFIYRKIINLSKSTIAEITVGKVINLLSNDLRRVESIMHDINEIWVVPLKLGVTMYLMTTMIGGYSLSGIIILLLFIVIQLYIARAIGNVQVKASKKTDERIHIMNEIINGIQAIKMYSWEKTFAKLVDDCRKNEIKLIRRLSFLRGIKFSFIFYMNRATTFVCIVAYVLSGHQLDAQYVYVVTLFYVTLSKALIYELPGILQTLSVGRVGIRRIQEFLEQPELVMSTNLVDNKGVILDDVTVKWSEDTYALQNINFTANPSELIAVIGTVGSGKSTLLQVILQEVIIDSGRLSVGGVISYASQEPWLFSGTIRQNILFGEDMDEVRFQEVVKVCALERDFSLFPNADQTIIGERGVMLSGGQKARVNLARAIYKIADIYLLDDPLSAVDAHVGQQIFQNCIYNYLKNKCVVLVTHQLQYLNKVDRIYLMEKGKIITSGTYEQVQKSGTYFATLMKSEDHDSDHSEETIDVHKVEPNENKDIDHDDEFKENKKEGTVDRKVYIEYFKFGGGVPLAFFVLFLFILCQSGSSATDYILTFWVNYLQEHNETHTNFTSGSDNDFFTTPTFIYIYSALLLFTIISANIALLSFFIFVMKASRNLHNSMFSKVVYVTMRFFHVNSSGRVLNRFTKDIGVIDEILPIIMVDTLMIAMIAGAACIINSIINPWILLPTVFLFLIFSIYRFIYLKTSRDLKRLEGTTKSPIFGHVTSTAQGLTTIRAFKVQKILVQEFDHYQDLNSCTNYLLIGCTRTLALNLDFSCNFYIALIILSFLVLKNITLGGIVGLAITQSLTLTGMLQWGIRQFSEMENQMTSVERIKEYADLDPEPDTGKQTVSKDWPEHAMIEFRDVSMQYSPTDPLVLKNLNFTILPKEKIGIVGRTGAGKSSLITVLFRLVNFDSQILIDNIDTKKIPLEILRSKIAIIPQDPVLFSGTLRRNLDPFDEYQDEDIWRALEDVELKNHVDSMALGLQSLISEGGANFSVGQKQLLCLARAILRSNKILILDEATANVDPQTDELIQATVRRKFRECTVLTIAHRLNTVLDSDKILVMDAGCAVEFGSPSELSEQNGIFKNLIDAQISISK